jgi:hypothetical protein
VFSAGHPFQYFANLNRIRARARCFDHIPVLTKLGNALLDIIRYLEVNANSMPDYGNRFPEWVPDI